MTFIATVIARNGAAVIADSLVTTVHRTIEEQDFSKFLQEKAKNSTSKDITLAPDEISKLFVERPSHTKNYECKLFKYDEYTAITTSGVARINGERIEDVVTKMISLNDHNTKYKRERISTKVKDFCNYLDSQTRKHIRKYHSFSGVRFVVTNFDKNTNLVTIYRVTVNPSSKEMLKDKSKKLVDFSKAADYEIVVCDGQNSTSERVLFGELMTVYGLIPKIVDKVIADLKIDKNKVPTNYVERLRSDNSIMTKAMWEEVKMVQLRDLSLQQAVDLAWLLMNIEMDFQKYTKSIPTVGGVIKLATIDKSGFKFISGNEIVKPANL